MSVWCSFAIKGPEELSLSSFLFTFNHIQYTHWRGETFITTLIVTTSAKRHQNTTFLRNFAFPRWLCHLLLWTKARQIWYMDYKQTRRQLTTLSVLLKVNWNQIAAAKDSNDSKHHGCTMHRPISLYFLSLILVTKIIQNMILYYL